MFKTMITPRISETDALGHINNTVLPVWFESGREPVSRIFTPNLEVKDWRLIVGKIEVEFLQQTFYGQPVEIRTFVAEIGRSSIKIMQEAWQDSILKARGIAVLVHYDYQARHSVEIPPSLREQLESHKQ